MWQHDKHAGTKLWWERGRRTEKCSATSHDSKTEKSRDVAMPPKKRPSISTFQAPQCLVTQLPMYVAQ